MTEMLDIFPLMKIYKSFLSRILKMRIILKMLCNLRRQTVWRLLIMLLQLLISLMLLQLLQLLLQVVMQVELHVELRVIEIFR